MHRTLPSVERVRELLRYDPEEGVFYWRSKRGHGEAGSIAGSYDGKGYLRTKIDYQSILLHRLAWYYVHGEMPAEIDHINRVKDDNRICNLRPCTKMQNQSNRSACRNSSTGVKGVSYHGIAKKYRAEMQVRGKKIYIGLFATVEQAAAAYKEREQADRGEFAP